MNKFDGQTEPRNGGTVPMRGSKNPVLGVVRHHCGHIATVHQYSGQKKAHLRYLYCDRCGCDQPSGEAAQAEIRAGTRPTLEALYESESAVSEPTANTNVETTDLPLETAQDAVSSEIEQTNSPTVEQPLETKADAVPEPVQQLPQQTPKPKAEPDKGIKPLKVVACAVIGGLFGCLLGAA